MGRGGLPAALLAFSLLAAPREDGAGGQLGSGEAEGANVRKAVVAGGAVVGLLGLGFVLACAVLPQFERTSIELPADCATLAAGASLPAALAAPLPGGGTAVRIAQDASDEVTAAITGRAAPYPATAYLIRKADRRILWSTHFANDIISAALDGGELYLYNDKIGYWINARTGLPERNWLVMDNYGGVSSSDRPLLATQGGAGHRFLETSAIITSWRADGRLLLRRRLTFGSLALGCFVDGASGRVTRLGPRAPGGG